MQIKGSELRITPASLSDALALEKAIGRALKGTRLELPETVTAEVTTDMFSDIIGAVLGVATSDEVEACLFKCAERALVGTVRVDRDFFEDVENRQYYYPIMVEVIKENVGPFFKGLGSQFAAFLPMAGKNQQQK
jgi:hypothetical protein